MTPTILKTKRRLMINKLQEIEQLEGLEYFGSDDVRLIFDLYSELDDERVLRMIDNIKKMEDELGGADEFVLILKEMLATSYEVDRLVVSRLASANTSVIPSYLITDEEDKDDISKWALYGLAPEFMINELWRRLVG